MLDFGTLDGHIWTLLLLVISTVVIFYWFSRRNHDFWEVRGIPYIKPLPFLGNINEYFAQPLHDVEFARYQKHGKIYGHFEANRPLLSVAVPDLLRSILVKDFASFSNRRSIATGDKVIDRMMTVVEGEDWKRIRTVVTPTFSTGKIKRMVNIFKECSATLVQNFHNIVKDGNAVDAKKVYGAFTMDIIASSAFSTKLDSHNDPENKFVQAARQVFSRGISWRGIMFFMAPSLMRLFKIPIFPSSAMSFFKDTTLQIIEERKRTGQKRDDFLQLLMDIAVESTEDSNNELSENIKSDIAENYGEEGSELKTFKSITQKYLTMDEIVAQCVIFFLAGYDTTASTLSFASYLLALNQDVQEKLRHEVDQVFEESKGELTYDALQKMKYLDNVISETLRIYSPAVRLERVAQEDYKLGDTGLTLQKGQLVSIPIYAIHRDPDHYPDPEKFDPDRFNPEEREKRHPYAYLPFGAGPRNCVGMRFALIEVKVCLVHVINSFKIIKSPKTKVPLEYFWGQGLLSPKEVLLDFEVRKDRPQLK